MNVIADNDSTISYHLLCKNFSIRYGEKEPKDIFVVGEERIFGRTEIIPMDILLLKRDKGVYLLLMTPNNPQLSIAPNLLYNIVIGK